MDNKVTLSFDKSVITKAKKYTEKIISAFHALMEFLLKKVTSNNYSSLEDFPISDWVQQVAEGEAVYPTKAARTKKASKEEYFKSRK